MDKKVKKYIVDEFKKILNKVSCRYTKINAIFSEDEDNSHLDVYVKQKPLINFLLECGDLKEIYRSLRKTNPEILLVISEFPKGGLTERDNVFFELEINVSPDEAIKLKNAEEKRKQEEKVKREQRNLIKFVKDRYGIKVGDVIEYVKEYFDDDNYNYNKPDIKTHVFGKVTEIKSNSMSVKNMEDSYLCIDNGGICLAKNAKLYDPRNFKMRHEVYMFNCEGEPTIGSTFVEEDGLNNFQERILSRIIHTLNEETEYYYKKSTVGDDYEYFEFFIKDVYFIKP